jgi:hypothetical protein
MTFSSPLLLAPNEALEEVIAHELCHVFFRAGGERPAVGVISEAVRESYPPDMWAEEEAVGIQIAKWNFTDDLMDIWIAVVDLRKGDWEKLYATCSALLKERRPEKTS